MSLATRCPACGTVFRVVQDQLKVSGGWVRCGQCHEVFNGLLTLFELPAAPPPAAPAAPPAAGLFVAREVAPPPSPPDSWDATKPVALDEWSQSDEPAVDLADPPAETTPLIDPDAVPAPARHPGVWAYSPRLADDDEASEAETLMPEDALDEGHPEEVLDSDVAEVAPEPEATTFEADERVMAPVAETALAAPAQSLDISQPSSLPANGPADSPAAAASPTDAQAGPGAATDHHEPGAGPAPLAEADLAPKADGAATWPPPRRRSKRQRKPAFMRQAERAARWRSPGVRAVLGSASALLGLMLTLQVVHHLRDDLAARWPTSRSALATWCQLAGCQLKAPRALASITLDSSALSRTTRPQVLRFEAELRNSGAHAVMAPALDVSFADNLGHQLVRKVLLPEQLGASPDGLPPNQTWHIEVPLQVGELPIAGFTAEVFYP